MQLPTFNSHGTDRMQALDGRPLALFRQRALSILLDFILAGALFLIVPGGILLALTKTGIWTPAANVKVELNFFGNWYSIAWLVLYFGFATYLGKGQTPGKRVTGIRVVSLVHDHLSLWHSIERALGYGASALEFGFGFIQYFIHPNRRTVHDRIAETIVITERTPRGYEKWVVPRASDQAPLAARVEPEE